MSILPVGPAPDADLERNASMYRAAVTPSRKGGLGPFGFMVVATLLVAAIVVGLAVTAVLFDQAWRKPRGMIMMKGAAPRRAALRKMAPAPRLTTLPSALPQGPNAFAK
jgi:hypothetical protein